MNTTKSLNILSRHYTSLMFNMEATDSTESVTSRVLTCFNLKFVVFIPNLTKGFLYKNFFLLNRNNYIEGVLIIITDQFLRIHLFKNWKPLNENMRFSNLTNFAS